MPDFAMLQQLMKRMMGKGKPASKPPRDWTPEQTRAAEQAQILDDANFAKTSEGKASAKRDNAIEDSQSSKSSMDNEEFNTLEDAMEQALLKRAFKKGDRRTPLDEQGGEFGARDPYHESDFLRRKTDTKGD